jgi:predicted DNA-binding transcriptional regulator AlpA
VVKRLLTLEEVADMFRIAPATIYRQRYASVPPGSLGFRVGRHVRFRSSDLQAWIESRITESTSRSS